MSDQPDEQLRTIGALLDPLVTPLRSGCTYALRIPARVHLTPADAQDITRRGAAIGVQLLVLADDITIEAAPEVDALRAEVERLRAELAEARDDLQLLRTWSDELAGLVPDDCEHGDPEGTQEGIISAHFAAMSELVSEAIDAGARNDGEAIARIRREAGLA